MAAGNGSERGDLAQALLLDDPGFLRGIVERTLQAILEEEMTAHLGAVGVGGTIVHMVFDNNDLLAGGRWNRAVEVWP